MMVPRDLTGESAGDGCDALDLFMGALKSHGIGNWWEMKCEEV